MNLLALFAISTLHIAKSYDSPDPAATVACSEVNFSFDLYKAAAQDEPGSFALATVQVFLILAQVYYVADGSTEEQLKQVLQYPRDSEEILRELQNLVYNTKALSFNDLHMEHTILYTKDLTVNSEMADSLKTIFQSRLMKLENDIAESQSFVLEVFTRLTLMNAYAACNVPILDGSSEIEYTEITGDFIYGQFRRSENINIDARYIGFWTMDNVKTIVIIPNAIEKIHYIEENINSEVINEVMSDSVMRKSRIILPTSFFLGSYMNLNRAFMRMSLTKLLEKSNDFGKIVDKQAKVDFVQNQLQMKFISRKELQLCDASTTYKNDGIEIFHLNHTFLFITVLAMENPVILAMGRFVQALQI